MITGHIQSGTFNDKDGICFMFDFHAGRPDIDWVLHSVSLPYFYLLNREIKQVFRSTLINHSRQTEE